MEKYAYFKKYKNIEKLFKDVSALKIEEHFKTESAFTGSQILT